MKPRDENGHLPIHQRPLRVLIVSGSDRRQYNCPGVDSKSRAMMLRMAERLPPEWEIDYEDLGNVYGRATIRSCNACVSTAMSLCVWPCNCYEKASKVEPDLMWDLDMYARLDLADAWAIVGPVNWYAPSSNLKLMFDRLVCMSGGNPREDLIDHKDPEKAIRLEQTTEWKELSRNHLEGRLAAFFSYGDGGGDEMTGDGRPRILLRKDYFDPSDEPFADMRDSYAPLVWQCRYSGIEVPDQLWRYHEFGVGRPYGQNQAEHIEAETWSAFEGWIDEFTDAVGKRGKVAAGPFRAFGYSAPGHLTADARLAWREIRMRLGHPRRDSSPGRQQDAGLNEDQTINPKKSEGEKLRE